MAGDWIKLQKDTPDKPEVLAIAARLNIDPDAVVGKLVRIWSWFDTHTVDGNASCVTFALLDRLSAVTGFAEQMALVGWLEQSGHDLKLTNFDYHNGETAKTRALGKNRANKSRSNAKGNASSVTKPSPEKRREEKINTVSKDTSSTALPDCPHEQILDLFAKHLPELPQPRLELWDGERAKNLRARWKFILTAEKKNGERYATTADEALEWFGLFFDYVSSSDFLMGRGGKWSADLAWLIKAENFSKVVQGNYENQKEAA